MITIRKSSERGYADHGWLKSYHSFSFANYFDQNFMGFGSLRVINEDRIATGKGFGTHGHRDMEIVTYVLDGALGHKDSLGNGAVIVPGDVQRMSAGHGIEHSEFNHAQGETHFLQIWLLPNRQGVTPSYQQTHFAATEKRAKLKLIASPDGAGGSVQIHANAKIFAGLFDADERASLSIGAGNLSYVHIVRGQLSVNARPLRAGDAAMLSGEANVALSDGAAAEVLVFELTAG